MPHLPAGALSRETTRRGLSQAELERLTGLSRSVLNKVNRGESVRDSTLGLIGQELDKHPILQSLDGYLNQTSSEQVPA